MNSGGKKDASDKLRCVAKGLDAHIRTLKIARIRTCIQAGFAAFCLYVGYRFYCFYLWALDRSAAYVHRPPSVEAFLPISAFLGLKRLILTGHWDRVHPAGLVLFLAAIFIAFAFRKGFCGWICPVGFVSNLIEKIAGPIRFRNFLPKILDYPLLSLKYLLLAFFAYVIVLKMDLTSIEAFLNSPYNLVVDAKMLQFFLQPGTLFLSVIAFLFLVSVVIRNFWCRYLCPYGALLGLLAMLGPVQVKRKASRCIDCKKCENTCPASLRVSAAATVRQPECVGCMECVDVCPQEDCLSLRSFRGRKFPILAIPAAVLAIFGLFYITAVLTGHWDTNIPPETMKHLYQSASTFTHP